MSDHNQNELKPCPFCGESPTTVLRTNESTDSAYQEIACENAKCPVQPIINENLTEEDGDKAWELAADRAFSAWNKRAEITVSEGEPSPATFSVKEGEEHKWRFERVGGCYYVLNAKGETIFDTVNAWVAKKAVNAHNAALSVKEAHPEGKEGGPGREVMPLPTSDVAFDGVGKREPDVSADGKGA